MLDFVCQLFGGQLKLGLRCGSVLFDDLLGVEDLSFVQITKHWVMSQPSYFQVLHALSLY